MKKLLLLLLLFPSFVQAQTVRADRFTLNTGPCVLRSGSGTPEGAVTGNVCDTYWRTDTGVIYIKVSGTGTTGWSTMGGVGGSGTPNTMAKWIGSTTLGDSFALTESGGIISIAPPGDIVTNPGGKDIIPAIPYDIRIGAPNLQYLSLDVAELHAQTLVAQNVIATIGGMIDVAPTTVLIHDVAPADTVIHVKHNEMAVGDRALLKTSPAGVPQFEVMAITAGPGGVAGDYTYTVTRNLDGTGANQWYSGDAVLNTGTTGDGLIELFSIGGLFGGFGPSIVGSVRTSSTFNAIEPRWAIGNLNGYYGYGVTTYGAAFGQASATNVTVDATNGFRIRNGTTNKLTADTAGNLSIVGDLTIGTSGVVRSGATNFTTGTGYYFDFNAGTPRFRIGNPAGNRMVWDGTTLTLVGNGSGITSINGGNITASSITATQLAANSVTTTQLDANAVTADKIAAGTITGDKIAATTITGVTITGSTINAGSGNEVVIDSSGITIAQGTDTRNKIKWGDGSAIDSSGNQIQLVASSSISLIVGDSAIWDGNKWYPNQSGKDLGSNGSRWSQLYLSGDIHQTPSTTTSDDTPVVYSEGNAIFYRKTNGLSTTCGGTSITQLVLEHGFVVGCTGTDPLTPLLARISALEEQVALLLGERK